jgi:hypothetical protein
MDGTPPGAMDEGEVPGQAGRASIRAASARAWIKRYFFVNMRDSFIFDIRPL